MRVYKNHITAIKNKKHYILSYLWSSIFLNDFLIFIKNIIRYTQ